MCVQRVFAFWEGGNERLCEMEPRLRLKRFSFPMGLEILSSETLSCPFQKNGCAV